MPHKNTQRQYQEDHFYHVYNRGINKQPIFLDQSDYTQFTALVATYLSPKDINSSTWWRSTLEENELELHAYCLMPNHFHLLVRLNHREGITRFMRRINNAYVRYFNIKYNRVGSLYQGKFKTILINNDAYLLHLSRYIHRNPSPLEVGPLKDYPYSSYHHYLNTSPLWLQTDFILDYFKSNIQNTHPQIEYQQFVEYDNLMSDESISHLTLE